MFLLNCITSFLGPSGRFPSLSRSVLLQKGQPGGEGGNPRPELGAGAARIPAGALGHFFPPRPPGGERLRRGWVTDLPWLLQRKAWGRASAGGR